LEEKLIAAIQHANERLYLEINQGETRPVGQRVGAVLTLAVLCDNGKRLLCLQVGDTRGYLFTEGELIQLCYDEDNIEFLVQQELLSVEDGALISAVLNAYDGVHAPEVEGTVTINGQVFDLYIAWRWFLVGNSALGILPPNIVLNALGLDPEVSGIQISRIEVNPGDQLLLCSDGLYKNMSDTEIMARLRQPGDSAGDLGQAALQRSQDQANQRRSPDDISALVVVF
ncbi:MAG TPA: SpoIIE family protein phosphatase, partial [Phototrophicaceae bacterium]|nr:SpoIIE family protein phosphatase [Phototrophicaceae bacterium]